MFNETGGFDEIGGIVAEKPLDSGRSRNREAGVESDLKLFAYEYSALRTSSIGKESSRFGCHRKRRWEIFLVVRMGQQDERNLFQSRGNCAPKHSKVSQCSRNDSSNAKFASLQLLLHHGEHDRVTSNLTT